MRAPVLVLLTGCSLVFARSPRAPDHKCTRSYALPVADTILATGDIVVIGAAATHGFGNNESSRDVNVWPEAFAVAFALFSVIPYTLSAADGYARIASCRERG